MTNTKVAWLSTGTSLVVNYNGETHTILKEDSGYEKVLLAIKENRLDEIPDLISLAKRVETYSNGFFKVENNKVLVDEEEVPELLGNRIVEFERGGLPFEPLVKFARNLNKNPSYRSVQQLYRFLEANKHPITDEGNFIAYKKVRPDFKDIYSGTFDNSPGNVVEMPRNQVNEDPEQSCSSGLHVATFEYACNSYGSSSDTILEVEVNPADVCAVPFDYSNQKMRVSKYKVLGVVANPRIETYVDTSHYGEDPDRRSDDTWGNDEEDIPQCYECGTELDDDSEELCEDCQMELEENDPTDTNHW